MSSTDIAGRSPYRFSVFEVDCERGELRKNGVKLRLEGQPLLVLQALLERPGEIVSRDELKQKLWPADTFVDFESSINAAVKRVRQVLDDSADTPRFVETLPRRGYRFICPVNGGSAHADARPRRSNRYGARFFLLMAGGAAAAILLGLNVGALRERLVGPPPTPKIRSLAVLPLENLTGDPDQEYLVDTLHDDLISHMSQIQSLRVISRTSVLPYKGQRTSLPEIARQLRVDGIIEGSVRQVGDRVRMNVQLIHAPADRHLWARDYDSREQQFVPADITLAIAHRLHLELTPQERERLQVRAPVSPEAHKLYLKASYFERKWTAESLAKAVELYQQALDLDPNHARAWVGLGTSYEALAQHRGRDDYRGRAKAALLRGLELDDTQRVAHQALGRMALREWNWAAADEAFRRAQVADPAWPGPSLYFLALGRFDDAIRAQGEIAERNPLNPDDNLVLGWTYFLAGRYDDAILQLKRTMELDPGNRQPHYQLAWNYAMKGMHQEAVAECDAYSQPEPELAGGDNCGWVYAVAGRRERALAFLEHLKKRTSGGGEPRLVMAQTYDALGDQETAIKLLYEAYEKRAPALFRLRVSGKYSQALRSDRRFQELLRRIGPDGTLATAHQVPTEQKPRYP